MKMKNVLWPVSGVIVFILIFWIFTALALGKSTMEQTLEVVWEDIRTEYLLEVEGEYKDLAIRKREALISGEWEIHISRVSDNEWKVIEKRAHDPYEFSVEVGETYKNERASYAYEKYRDKDFVLLLNAENGAWTHDARHPKPYSLCWTWKGFNSGILPNQESCWKNPNRFVRTHYDYGFCGMSDGYRKWIVDDPRFFTDWKWQIDQCYEQYKNGTRFYGWDHRKKRGRNILFNN